MPAINLTRLRTQLRLLLQQFAQPYEFTRGMREIFLAYADPTQPMVLSSETASGQRFNSPLLLNRELEKVLSPYCSSAPQDTLAILDLLWIEPEEEIKQLAASLLGKLPIEQSSEVTSRLDIWSRQAQNRSLLPYLHLHGSVILRKFQPEAWITLLEVWKKSNEVWQMTLALHGLIPLIQDVDFINLPIVFSFLFPMLSPLDPNLAYEMETVITELARRSEIETVYFLKQAIGGSQDRSFGRFIRRIIPEFSQENQASLRQALKAHIHLG